MKFMLLALVHLALVSSMPSKKSYLRNWETSVNGSYITSDRPLSRLQSSNTPTIVKLNSVTPPGNHSFVQSIPDMIASIPVAFSNFTNKFVNDSEVAESFNEFEKTTTGAVTNFYNGASDAASNAYSTVSSAAVDSYEKVSDISNDLYKKAANATIDTYNGIVNSTSSWWDSTTSWFSSAWYSVGSFFSSGWNKVVSWWKELEEQVKEVIHVIIRIVELVVGIAIFCAVLWGYRKFRKAYRYVKKHTLEEV